MVRSLFVATLLSSSVVLAAPTIKLDSAKTNDIRTFMKLTGTGDIGPQVLTQIVASMQHEMPNLPAAFWDDFKKKQDPDELTQKLIPIYDKHFSAEDLKVLIQFYQTPTGKRFMHELPNITAESMDVAKAWGKALGERAIDAAKKQQSSPAK